MPDRQKPRQIWRWRRAAITAVAALTIVPTLSSCGGDADEDDVSPSARGVFGGGGLHYVTDIAIVVPDGLTRSRFPLQFATAVSELPAASPTGRLPALLEISVGEDDNPTDAYLGVEVVLIDTTSSRTVERERIARVVDPTIGGYQPRGSGKGLLKTLWDLITFSDDEEPEQTSNTRALAYDLAEMLDERFLKPLDLGMTAGREIRIVTLSELKAARRRAGIAANQFRQDDFDEDGMTDGVGDRRGRRVETGASAAGISNFFSDDNGAPTPPPRPAVPVATPIGLAFGPTPEEAGAAIYFGFYDNLLDAELYLETARASNQRAMTGTTTIVRRFDDPEDGPRYRLFALTRTPDEARLRCEALRAVGTECQGVQWPVQ